VAETTDHPNNRDSTILSKGSAGFAPQPLDLLGSGIEDLLRFDAPVQMISRVVKEGMALCGVDLHPSDVQMILLGAANRDPAQFKAHQPAASVAGEGRRSIKQ
jgi:cytochrome P450